MDVLPTPHNPPTVAAVLQVRKGDYRGTTSKWIRRDTVPNVPASPSESWGLKKERSEHLAVSIPNFPVAAGVRESLLSQLQQMADAQNPKDYRQDPWTEEYSPSKVLTRQFACVQDILDPSLGAFEFRAQFGMEQQWLPSDVFVDAAGKVTFNSPVQGVDPVQFPQFEDHCAAALAPMLPHFEIVLQESLRNRHLQVVVKAQKYLLWHDGLYEGQLHIEGNEYDHLAAVGIYYLHLDPRLKGGELELARVERGGCGWVNIVRNPVVVYDNQCVVFDNRRDKEQFSLTTTQYHRLMPLSAPPCTESWNWDNSISIQARKAYPPAERIILNFFLVDPHTTLPSTATDPTPNRFDPKLSAKQRAKLWKAAVSLRERIRAKRSALVQEENPHLRTRVGQED